MRFVKMQGLGNDYLFLNCLDGVPDDLPRLAVEMSDRHFGVGADGLICLFPGRDGAFAMRMFNSDGSEGEMCGNGIRCLAKYIRDCGLSSRRSMTIETGAGLRRVELLDGPGRSCSVRVDMGRPRVSAPLELQVLGETWRVVPVSMGNPHGVLFLTDIGNRNLAALGPALEKHPMFPRGINVELAEVLARDRLRMRVWERGSGETLACGTGACAVLAAALSDGLTETRVQMELPGGVLELDMDNSEGHIFLTGPAVTVYEGDYPERTE